MSVIKVDRNQGTGPLKEMVYSSYQTNIFKAITESEDNLLIEAVAGSGKTTTLVHALRLLTPGTKALFLAFNKSIADELGRVAPPWVEAKTLHSLGYQIIRDNYGWAKVNGNKTRNLLLYSLFDIKKVPSEKKDWLYSNARELSTLVSRMKYACISPEDVSRDLLMDIADSLGLLLTMDDSTCKLVYDLYQASCAFTGEKGCCVVDFDDMISIPATRDIRVPTYDIVFVDEAQDLNTTQRVFIEKLAKRVVAVGDTHQAIYGFRGADHNSMQRLKENFSCHELPLSISYRCPKSVIRLAQNFVPHIEANSGAPQGETGTISESVFLEGVCSGDHILCRINSDLAQVAMSLVRKGHTVSILGKSLGTDLLSFAKDVNKMYGNLCMPSVSLYAGQKMSELPENKKAARYRIMEMADTISYLLSEEEESLARLKEIVSMLFVDNDLRVPHVTLSTIHKAKGLEADRVFLIRPDLLPHPMASSGAELQQEDNLHYVAITRAKKEFYYVTEEDN